MVSRYKQVALDNAFPKMRLSASTLAALPRHQITAPPMRKYQADTKKPNACDTKCVGQHAIARPVGAATQTKNTAAARPYAPRKWDIHSRKSPYMRIFRETELEFKEMRRVP